jgi:hypothetical protein
MRCGEYICSVAIARPNLNHSLGKATRSHGSSPKKGHSPIPTIKHSIFGSSTIFLKSSCLGRIVHQCTHLHTTKKHDGPTAFEC